ncbi:MAG: GH3 auxin-responsive promoter family protein, partial [Candidatus Thorarchaeota archaeon]
DISDMDDKLWEYAKLMIRDNVTGIQGITTLSLTIIRRMQDLYGIRLLNEFKGSKYESKIRESLNDDGRMDVSTLWPDLKLFLATGISTDPYREWITKTLPEAMIWEIYGGSEGYYAGQLEANDGMALSSHINYFEFIPEQDCESPNPIAISLEEVKADQRYEIVITNIGGRYRYRLGDMLTMKSTDPFVVTNIGRKGRVVNLSGEKLCEAHIYQAIDYACQKTGAELQDYTVVGEVIRESGLPYYTIAALFRNSSGIDLHEFVGAFEQNIMDNNNEFRVVRETGALGPTQLALMRNSIFEQRIKATHIQTKPLPLSTDTSILNLCEVVA